MKRYFITGSILLTAAVLISVIARAGGITAQQIAAQSGQTKAAAGGGGGVSDGTYYSGDGTGDSDYTTGPTSTGFNMHLDAYGSPVSIGGNTYYVAWSSDSGQLQTYYRTSFNGISKGGLAYASFPASMSGFGSETSTGFGARVVVSGGQVTKLALYGLSNSGTITLKISLFNSSGTLLSSGTADTVSVNTTLGWKEATLASPVTL